MGIEDFLQCLSCGKKLGPKSKEIASQCTECILKLDFKTKDLDHIHIDRNIQRIFDFFSYNIPFICLLTVVQFKYLNTTYRYITII